MLQTGFVAFTLSAVACSGERRPLEVASIGGAQTESASAASGAEGDLRPLRPEETTSAIEARAKEILGSHGDAPLGTSVPFELEGRSYVARIEQHYHEPGGPLKPWGHHRGVTVYAADSSGVAQKP